MDIVEYSRQSVTEQIRLKEQFNAILSDALADIAVNDRIILDTGDGAAISFLGDPEDALFVAMSLRDHSKAGDTPAGSLGIRIGINLGPVKLVKDINGRPNLIGDGINVAQRIMSFAEPGHVMVSRSYYEVVSCLSAEYAKLFEYIGARTDKHVREHEVYSVGFDERLQQARPPKRRNTNHFGESQHGHALKPGKLTKQIAIACLAVGAMGGAWWLGANRSTPQAAPTGNAQQAQAASKQPAPVAPVYAAPSNVTPVPNSTVASAPKPPEPAAPIVQRTTPAPEVQTVAQKTSEPVDTTSTPTSKPSMSSDKPASTVKAHHVAIANHATKPTKPVVAHAPATAPASSPTAPSEAAKPQAAAPHPCPPSECWAGERR